ncbi:hypothetical protein Glove_428g50 [Diversispora epigaea]|uniref:Major facilitator superfamily (MFS) profile domain-containing protein n=1 Tax=Diversispora epigaea TaxID=1348612 RepID=A0A397GVH4_9GLOM|nr:hypothetical protein Glove_428g50 [Diversispora epigaea]
MFLKSNKENNVTGEKKLLKKMDSRLLPMVTLIYLLSFLGRVNLGNAKLANLESDLGLVDNQYNWALSIFFLGYILFEVPSNLILIKTKPSIWIPSIMIAWGAIMTIMAFVKDFMQLMLARFFLGTFEAGLFPGIIFYLTLWYKRSEQTYRISLFFSGATISGALSGLFAFFVVNRNYDLSGWQCIFLIDGFASIFVAIIAYFGIPDFPETAAWLTEEERELVINRLREDSAYGGHTSRFSKDQFLAAVKDWKVWCSMFIFMGILVSYYSFSFFIPEIVNGLGFDLVISQLLAAPPFICGFITTIIIAILSERLDIRALFLLFGLMLTICGYIILILPGMSTAVKYTGACIIGSGLCPSITISISWLTNNLAGNVKRAVGSAMMIAWGNIGGIIASQIYQQTDFPDYKTGHMIAIGFLLMSFILVNLQYWGLKLENKKKVRNPSWYIKGKNEEEIKQMGDMHPRFVYNL